MSTCKFVSGLIASLWIAFFESPDVPPQPFCHRRGEIPAPHNIEARVVAASKTKVAKEPSVRVDDEQVVLAVEPEVPLSPLPLPPPTTPIGMTTPIAMALSQPSSLSSSPATLSPEDLTMLQGDYGDYEDYEEIDEDSYNALGDVPPSAQELKVGTRMEGEESSSHISPCLVDPVNPNEFSSNSTFLEALATCTSLDCVRAAHAQPRGPATYNFPHAIIIGFQKSATTSTHVLVSIYNLLFSVSFSPTVVTNRTCNGCPASASAHILPPKAHTFPLLLCRYLGKQDNVLKPLAKEPDFFTRNCSYNPPKDCPADLTKKYLREILPLSGFIASNGTAFTYEASTHLARGGRQVINGLRESMPWLRLIVCLREPISRSASMLIHTLTNKKGCLYYRKNLGNCLLTKSQINGSYDGQPTTYTDTLRMWFEHWNPEQIHVVQVGGWVGIILFTFTFTFTFFVSGIYKS